MKLKELLSRKNRSYFLSFITITYFLMMFIIWNVNINGLLSINRPIYLTANFVMIFAVLLNIDTIYKEKSFKNTIVLIILFLILINNALNTYHSERALSLVLGIIPIFIMYILAYFHKPDRLIKYGFNILIGLVFFYNVLGLIGFIFKFDNFIFNIPNILTDNYRYSSILTNPNSWGEFAVVSLVLSLVFFLKNTNIKSRLIYGVSIVFNVIALVLSMSRSAVLICVVIYIGLLIFYNKWDRVFKKLLLLSLFGALVIVIALAIYDFDLFLNIFRLNQGLNEREFLWEYAFNLYKEYHPYGIGYGNGAMYLSIAEHLNTSSVHNMYLGILVEVGYFPFIILMLYFIHKIYVSFKYSKYTKVYNTELLLISIFLVAFLVGSIFEHTFFKVGPVNTFIFILFALIIYMVRKVKDEGIYKKKVTHIITGLDSGGAEAMLYKLMMNRNKDKFTYKVISLDTLGFYGERLLSDGVNVVALNMRGKLNIIVGLFKLSIHIAKSDVIQTWLYHANFLGLVLGKLTLREKIIWGVRQADISYEHNKKSTVDIARLSKYLSCFTDVILSNSDEVTLAHENLGYSKIRFVTIYNGFDISSYKPDLGARSKIRNELQLGDRIVFINVARYDIQKDHDNLFASLKLLKSDNVSFKMILCGKGISFDNNELVEKIKSYNLQGEVILLGERTDINDVLNAADYFILSSLGEGFPNVLGEAMAVGLIPISTDAGDSRLVVGEYGKIVPTKSSEALYLGIKEMLNLDEETKNQIRINARRRIIENFDIKTVTKKYEDLY